MLMVTYAVLNWRDLSPDNTEEKGKQTNLIIAEMLRIFELIEEE